MKEKAMTAIQKWTPVHKGKYYCSPACGGKCTWDSYQHAKRRGSALAKSLGWNWTYQVTENLGGWSHCAVDDSRQLSVAPNGLRYHAILNISGFGGWDAVGNTPRKAVQQVLLKAKADMLASFESVLSLMAAEQR